MTAIFWLINTALDIYFFFLIANVIMSWLTAFGIINTYQPLVRSIGSFLYAVTEPALRPIRNFLPHMGGIDISPLVLILLIQFLQVLLRTSIAPAFGVYGY